MKKFRRRRGHSFYDHFATVRTTHSDRGQRPHRRRSVMIRPVFGRIAGNHRHLFVWTQATRRRRSRRGTLIAHFLALCEAFHFSYTSGGRDDGLRHRRSKQFIMILLPLGDWRRFGRGAVREVLFSIHAVTSRDHDDMIDRVRRERRAIWE